ncbi:hypothetical protein [Mycolicibacterium anyangense]|uniref:hypothetical protein n=1 Tax=Mycolicibacterium anyangense TaxID=1431246 RepID=UPI0013D3304A|nr:hypothetical protein [Mycolicibacterium anyangense]
MGSTGMAAAGTVVLAAAAAGAGVAVAAAGEMVWLTAADGVAVVSALAVDARPVAEAGAGEPLVDFGFEAAEPLWDRAEPVDFAADVAPPDSAVLWVDSLLAGAALATPVTPPRDAQNPTVSAPAPIQVARSACCCGARWRGA